MSIHNAEKFVSTLWDWGCLDGCFGQTRIKPTDVDGMVERNGEFLWMETKSPRVAIPTGQMRMFEQLTRLGVFTVLIIWGNPGCPEELLLIRKKGRKRYANTCIYELRSVVAAWFEFAQGKRDTPFCDEAISDGAAMTLTDGGCPRSDEFDQAEEDSEDYERRAAEWLDGLGENE